MIVNKASHRVENPLCTVLGPFPFDHWNIIFAMSQCARWHHNLLYLVLAPRLFAAFKTGITAEER